MNRYIFLFLIAAFSLLLHAKCVAQNNIVYGAGISYTNGVPTFVPPAKSARVAIDTVTSKWYEYATPGGWRWSGDRVQDISGCSAPAYTPGKAQSRLVLNNCTEAQNGHGPELYKYTGTEWLCLNCGGNYTAGDGIDITGTEITNTGDLSNTNELQTLSVAGNNLTISDGNTVTLPTPSSTLDGLTDVTITSPANNQILQYNSAGAQWVNATLSAITGIGASGKAAYWTSSSEISYSDNFRYNSDHKQLQIGNFTRGSGVVSTQSIITDGEIRAAGGYGLRSPVVGDNTKIGMYYESGYLKLYLANSPLLELQGAGATQLPSVSFTRYINPSSGTTNFGIIQANVATQASGSYSGTISYIRDITSVNNSNPSGTGNFTSFAMQPTLSGYGYHRGVYFAPITAGSGNVIAIENTIGNNYLNSLSGSTGIGTSSINASSKLEVTSTTQGVLFPRMTATQRDAIASPPDGLVVYNTTAAKLQVRAASAWVDLH